MKSTPKRLAIIRPDCTVISRAFYNSQELGLAINLAKLGITVDVYYAGHVKWVEAEVVEETKGLVTLIQMPFKNIPLIGQGYYPHLVQELKKRTYDLIQVNEYNDIINYLAINYAKRNNIPTIVYQGMYKNMSGKVNQLYTWLHDHFLLPKLIKSVAATYCKTQRAADFLKTKGFERADVLPVGLDPSPFKSSEENKQLSKVALGIPEHHKVALYIGNFEPRRNINFLLDVAKDATSEHITFVFIGAGELFEQAQTVVNASQLNNVRILDRVPQKQLATIYDYADLFLLASDYEIYGMVLIEAMYHETVVISNITAGSESLISSGVDGILIEHIDKTSWLQTIKQLCGNEETLAEFKTNAKQKVNNQLLWQHVAKRYVDEILLPLSSSKS